MRMLTFDPRRRAKPDEILAHEHFGRADALSEEERRSERVADDCATAGTKAAGIEATSDAAMSDAAGGGDRGGASAMSGVATDGSGTDATGGGASAPAVDSNFWEVSEPELALRSLELAFTRVGTGAAGAAGTAGGDDTWRDVFRRFIAGVREADRERGERECVRRR